MNKPFNLISVAIALAAYGGSVLAHSGAHETFGLMAIIGHWLSQASHLSVLAGAVAIGLIGRLAVSRLRSRRRARQDASHRH